MRREDRSDGGEDGRAGVGWEEEPRGCIQLRTQHHGVTCSGR